MKLNKIISLAVACFMLISCIPAFATTATAEPEVSAITIESGDTRILTFTADDNGAYLAEAALTGGKTNATGGVYRYGVASNSTRTTLNYNSATGKFGLDKIIRYTSTVEMLEDATKLTFNGTFFENGTQKFLSSYPVVNSLYYPKAGDTVVLDTVLDLNTLTFYYYVDNVLVAENTYVPTAGVTELKYGNALVYIGNDTITTAGTDFFKVSNATQTVYPAGTTIESVRSSIKVHDVNLNVTPVVPVTLASWRWVIDSLGNDTYGLRMAHNTYFDGGIGIPFPVNFSDGSEDIARVSVKFNVLKDLAPAYKDQYINAVYKKDGTRLGDHTLKGNGTPINFVDLPKGTYTFDAIADKKTKTVYYYINGRLLGSNSYVPADTDTASTKIELEHLGFYFGLDNGTASSQVTFANITDAKFYDYPAAATLASVQNEVLAAVSTLPATPTMRNSSTVGTMTKTDAGHVYTTLANPSADVTLNPRIIACEKGTFATTTDKYMVIGTKLAVNNHKNSNFFQFCVKDSKGVRANSSVFAGWEGDVYDVKVIVDFANKEYHFYRDNTYIGKVAASASQVDAERLLIFSYQYDAALDGYAAGEETYTISDSYTRFYSDAYTGTLADVVAAEVGTDISTCYLGLTYYTPWKEGDFGYNDRETHHRVFATINGFDAEKYNCYMVGYSLDENGNEVLGFVRPFTKASMNNAELKANCDVIKVFIWDKEFNPEYQAYVLDYCKR